MYLRTLREARNQSARKVAIHCGSVQVKAVVVKDDPLRFGQGRIQPVPEQTQRHDAGIITAFGREVEWTACDHGGRRGGIKLHFGRDGAVVQIAHARAGNPVSAESGMSVEVPAPGYIFLGGRIVHSVSHAVVRLQQGDGATFCGKGETRVTRPGLRREKDQGVPFRRDGSGWQWPCLIDPDTFLNCFKLHLPTGEHCRSGGAVEEFHEIRFLSVICGDGNRRILGKHFVDEDVRDLGAVCGTGAGSCHLGGAAAECGP